LENNHANCNEVRQTEPGIPDPGPRKQLSCDDQQQPNDDERDEQHMGEKDYISR